MIGRNGLLIVAVVASATLVGWGFHNPGRTGAAVGLAWLVGMGVAIGALLVDMILMCCNATWQLPLRGPLEALHGILPWLTAAGLVASAAVVVRLGLHPKELERLLLTTGFLGFLSTCSLALGGLSQRQDRDPDPVWSRRRRFIGCGALPLAAVGSCLATMDGYRWCDAFSSSILSPLLVTGGVLSAVAAWSMLGAMAARSKRLPITSDHLVALGRLQLALVIVVAYLAFSQLIICWMGDLPYDAAWYLPRLHGYLGWFGLGILGIGSAVPFLALLSHDLKRHQVALLIISGITLVGQALTVWWIVMPSIRGPSVILAGCDLCALVAIASWSGLLVIRHPRCWVLGTHVPSMSRGLAYRERLP